MRSIRNYFFKDILETNKRLQEEIENSQRLAERNQQILLNEIAYLKKQIAEMETRKKEHDQTESERLNSILKEVLGIRNKLWDNDWTPNQNLRKQLFFKAGQETADYIENFMICVPTFPHPEDILNFALSQISRKGLVLEFGVYTGKTINQIAQILSDTKIYGFDSFKGLPENWRSGFYKGTFKSEELPVVESNVELIVGWFEDTLKDFVKKHKQYCSFIHIDCDLYSSTKTIFEELKECIQTDTVILFDEYFNYPGWKNGEFKAFQEFVRKNDVQYEYIAYCDGMEQVAVKIL